MEFVSSSTVELIKTNASDEDVARAAWVSNYGNDARTKDTSRIEGLIRFLYSNKHMSPFEHGSFTFFVDTPIFVAREFFRHRTQSFNEVSGRYTEMTPRFYIPPRQRPLVQQGKIGAYTFAPGTDSQYNLVVQSLKDSFTDSWNKYQSMLAAGIAREVARDVLPLSLYTQFYATVNPRNLMQFLSLRRDPSALYEIRQVAGYIENIFKQSMPLTHKAYKEYT